MLDAFMDAVIDSIKLIPFLFLTYLVMGILEHASGEKTKKIIEEAGKVGPVWGGLIGAFPQCGFSAAASNLYIGRIISLGTLVSIYLSTSDEMLPIFISEKVALATILKIITTKIIIGMISGFAAELFFGWLGRRHKKPEKSHDNQADCQCNCGAGILTNSIRHTIKVFVFILIISLAINIVIAAIGQESMYALFADIPVLGEMLASLVGLIPNCAASVVITQLYLEGIIGPGPMMSGLLVSAGVGLLVLFKENRHMKENFSIVAILYILGVVWGVIIDVTGLTF